MKKVKVLGPGCARCNTTAEMVKTEAEKAGIAVTVEKITDYAAIAGSASPRPPVSSSTAGSCMRAGCRRLKTFKSG